MLRNYKLVISYDGTNYSGWQIQPNGLTIQNILQDIISVILREKIVLIGAGRTDAGVHAKGQAAHFLCSCEIDLYRFQGSLNGMLPRDIRVREIIEVPISFHAQYSALGKIYHYHLHLERVQDPFDRLYCLHVREKINVAALKHAAALFVGTHDFTSFTNEAHSGSASLNAIRTLHRLDVFETAAGLRLEFEGNGFLYKMVRNITGTLLEIGSGKRDKREVSELLLAKDRRKSGKAAPSHGLFLMHVLYPEMSVSEGK